MIPIKGGKYFVCGNATPGSAGLYSLSARTLQTRHLRGLEEKIWNVAASSAGEALLMIGDERRLFMGRLRDDPLEFSSLTELSLPGSGRLEQVAFQPLSENCFAVRGGKNIDLIQLAEGSSPQLGHKICQTDKEAAYGVSYLAWNPHDPNVLAYCRETEGAVFHDIRVGDSSGSLLALPCLIGKESRIKWNPFIPYWTAVNSGDGLLVYDLRYTARTPIKSLEMARPGDFCWSNSNCEILIGALASRSVCLWNLRDGCANPAATVPHVDCGGNIVEVFASSDELGVFYGRSLLGKMIKIDVDPGLLESMAPKSECSTVGEIEKALYCRDFDKVYGMLLQYSDNATRKNFHQLESLINQTLPSSSIDASTWTLASLPSTDGSFEQDLNNYSRVCPPGFSSLLHGPKDMGIAEAVESVRLKVQVMGLVEGRSGTLLCSLLDRILKATLQTRDFLPLNILLKIIALTMGVDKVAALCFGRDLLAQNHRDMGADACRLVHRLLFPTVFDVEAGELLSVAASPKIGSSPDIAVPAASVKRMITNDISSSLPTPPAPLPAPNISRSAHASTLGSPKLTANVMIFDHLETIEDAIEMIDFEISVEEGEDDKSRVETIMQKLSHEPGSTISAQPICTYLLTLLTRSQMDEYFSSVGKLIALHPLPAPFARVILEHMEREVVPKLKYILAQAIDTQRPTLVLRAIQLIATIVESLGLPLPSGLEPFLLDRLRRLIRSIQPVEYRNSNGYQKLTAFVDSMRLKMDGDGLGREFARLKGLLARVEE